MWIKILNCTRKSTYSIDKCHTSDILPRLMKNPIQASKEAITAKYGLQPVSNVDIFCEKVSLVPKGAVVECGVFNGATLFTFAQYCKLTGIDRDIYGFDAFSGFPIEPHPYDKPLHFEVLRKKGEITQEHYEQALKVLEMRKERHLAKEYWVTEEKTVFERAKDFLNITLIKGDFKDTLRDFDKPIAILRLDCDLYKSYLTVLNMLYTKVVSGGVIIFDEYYSLKYPGARIAVQEFFKDKLDQGYFEIHYTKNKFDESKWFEHWCFTKL